MEPTQSIPASWSGPSTDDGASWIATSSPLRRSRRHWGALATGTAQTDDGVWAEGAAASRCQPANPAPINPARVPNLAETTAGGCGRVSRSYSAVRNVEATTPSEAPMPPPRTITSGSRMAMHERTAAATARAAELTIAAASTSPASARSATARPSGRGVAPGDAVAGGELLEVRRPRRINGGRDVELAEGDRLAAAPGSADAVGHERARDPASPRNVEDVVLVGGSHPGLCQGGAPHVRLDEQRHVIEIVLQHLGRLPVPVDHLVAGQAVTMDVLGKSDGHGAHRMTVVGCLLPQLAGRFPRAAAVPDRAHRSVRTVAASTLHSTSPVAVTSPAVTVVPPTSTASTTSVMASNRPGRGRCRAGTSTPSADRLRSRTVDPWLA